MIVRFFFLFSNVYTLDCQPIFEKEIRVPPPMEMIAAKIERTDVY